jgi:hypothetical protein
MTGRHRLEFEVDCDAAVAEELFAFLADVIGSHRDLGLYSAGMTPVVDWVKVERDPCPVRCSQPVCPHVLHPLDWFAPAT